MTTALYLEHYLDSLESLPIELQRNFTLMRDLDTRAQSLMREIDVLADVHVENVSHLNTEKRKEGTEKIQKLFNKAKEYGDDKVQLAIQTYELVDKHIRRLDSDLARFEAEIKEKGTPPTPVKEDVEPVETKKGRSKKIGDKEKKKKGKTETESGFKTTDEEPSRKKGNKKSTTTTASTDSALGMNITHPADALDMPVDPNEPTYCLCHQVSYGEMIGCDNSDCPIEWFHFACVGLTIKPKGKWYCPKCSADRKKKAT